jgi:hypothetical protein
VAADEFESKVMRELTKAIWKKNRENPQEYGDDSFHRLTEDTEVMIRTKFVIGGIITVSTETREYSQETGDQRTWKYTGKIWKLTEYGRAQFSLLGA